MHNLDEVLRFLRGHIQLKAISKLRVQKPIEHAGGTIMKKCTIKAIGLLAVMLIIFAACARMTPTQRRVVGGGAIGAGTGAAVGGLSGGDPGVGAAIGGAAGALGGYLLDQYDRRDYRYHDDPYDRDDYRHHRDPYDRERDRYYHDPY
jgi:uncharacterized protein YcfJ